MKYALVLDDGTEVVVSVIKVKPTQLPNVQATRTNWGNNQWSIYISEDAGPEVLEWEMEQIKIGTTWDGI